MRARGVENGAAFVHDGWPARWRARAGVLGRRFDAPFWLE